MIDQDISPEEELSTYGLLVRVREGDRAAAELLFATHRERLVRALRAKLSPETRRQIEADEIVQETFRKALVSLDRFEWRGQGAFLAWLLQIALRTFDDMLRTERSRPPTHSLSADALESGGHDDARLADESGTPSAALARAEELQMLERALDHLGEEDRDLVIRRTYLCQDYRSLAADLGITEGAVRMRMSRALYEMSRWVHADS